MTSKTASFSGERFENGEGGILIAVEHLHRYVTAATLSKGRRVLDIGCGSGYGSQILTGFESYTGIDVSPETIKSANKHFGNSKVKYLNADATMVPLDSGTFDLVTCFEVLEHVDEPHLIVKEAARLLAPGGVFIFSTPDRENYNSTLFVPNPFHVHEMNESEIRGLFANVFSNMSLFSQSIIQSSFIRTSEERIQSAAELGLHPVAGEEEPPVIYWVGIASQGALPSLPSSVAPILIDRNINGELVKTYLQLKSTEAQTVSTQQVLAAADERELVARKQILALEEALDATRQSLSAADERELVAREQILALEKALNVDQQEQ
jgi:ubiquinone/menaquinone biosynthesis C-methylase UbiE